MPTKAMTQEQWREHARTHTPQNSHWLNDAQGIPCSRVCDEPGCEEAVKARYKPEIFDTRTYHDVVEEPVDED